jgi:hypothetical protein
MYIVPNAHFSMEKKKVFLGNFVKRFGGGIASANCSGTHLSDEWNNYGILSIEDTLNILDIRVDKIQSTQKFEMPTPLLTTLENWCTKTGLHEEGGVGGGDEPLKESQQEDNEGGDGAESPESKSEFDCVEEVSGGGYLMALSEDIEEVDEVGRDCAATSSSVDQSEWDSFLSACIDEVFEEKDRNGADEDDSDGTGMFEEHLWGTTLGEEGLEDSAAVENAFGEGDDTQHEGDEQLEWMRLNLPDFNNLNPDYYTRRKRPLYMIGGMPKYSKDDPKSVTDCCCTNKAHQHEAVNTSGDCCVHFNGGGCPVGDIKNRYPWKQLSFWEGETFILANASAAEAWFCEVLCLSCFLEAVKRNQKVLSYCYINHTEMCMLKKNAAASMFDFTEAIRDVYSAWKQAAVLCVEKFA